MVCQNQSGSGNVVRVTGSGNVVGVTGSGNMVAGNGIADNGIRENTTGEVLLKKGGRGAGGLARPGNW